MTSDAHGQHPPPPASEGRDPPRASHLQDDEDSSVIIRAWMRDRAEMLTDIVATAACSQQAGGRTQKDARASTRAHLGHH